MIEHDKGRRSRLDLYIYMAAWCIFQPNEINSHSHSSFHFSNRTLLVHSIVITLGDGSSNVMLLHIFRCNVVHRDAFQNSPSLAFWNCKSMG